MAYFEDLSPYTYTRGAPVGMVNIGWLDFGHAFEKGTTSEEFRIRLLELCSKPVNPYRGIHICEGCTDFHEVERQLDANARAEGRLGPDTREFQDAWNYKHPGKPLPYGHTEIHVAGLGNTIYAAPVLVGHYVVVHDYKPVTAFIDAILASRACLKVEFAR